MKKLSKLKLSEKVDTLTDSEMKMIFGSSGTGTNNCPTDGTCSGSCTISVKGQEFTGTCKMEEHIPNFPFCTCVQN